MLLTFAEQFKITSFQAHAKEKNFTYLNKKIQKLKFDYNKEAATLNYCMQWTA
jgi:hypothetical protein